MSGYFGAGRLNRPARVLRFRRDGGLWKWEPVQDIWAAIEYSQRTNIFSRAGVGAKDVSLVIWRQELSLHNAIEADGAHLFLTSITHRNRNQMDVRAALVELVQCEDKYTQTKFPAVLTEKYVRFGETAPHSVNAVSCVLVTPKEILLNPGRLIEAGGVACPIRTTHLLDPYKNEYEIERKVDL